MIKLWLKVGVQFLTLITAISHQVFWECVKATAAPPAVDQVGEMTYVKEFLNLGHAESLRKNSKWTLSIAFFLSVENCGFKFSCSTQFWIFKLNTKCISLQRATVCTVLWVFRCSLFCQQVCSVCSSSRQSTRGPRDLPSLSLC